MGDRIKITNCSGHNHSVRLLLPNGGYSYKSLKPNQFAIVNEEQFLDIYNSTRDFSGGFLTFDKNALSQEVVSWLGIEDIEDLDFGIVGYTDAEIKDILKGQIGKFKGFIKEVKELPADKSVSFSKRLFEIASSMSEEITQSKARDIEDATKMKFDLNEEFKNTSK